MKDYERISNITDLYNLIDNEALKISAIGYPRKEDYEEFLNKVGYGINCCPDRNALKAEMILDEFNYLSEEEVIQALATKCKSVTNLTAIGCFIEGVKDLKHDAIRIDGYGNLSSVTKDDIICLADDLKEAIKLYLPEPGVEI